MPTYEYQCLECGHLFEAFQSMSDELIEECPACKGSVKRLISSGAGLIFKGSGFYITDYKKKETALSKPKSGKTDSKPAETKKKDSKNENGKSSDSSSGENTEKKS